MRRAGAALLGSLVFAGCATAAPPIPETVVVAAGRFVAGSERAEREAAYRLDERAYGHNVTRKSRWYEDETRKTVTLAAFRVMRAPVTNAQYAAFVAATGHPAPDVDRKTWAGYRLIHPYQRTRRHAWIGARPPVGRGVHPVVLVSHGDARAYAAWLGLETGVQWRLPSEAEREKAARGTGVHRPLSRRREPVRHARRRRSGIRMDRDAGRARPVHRQGRLMGRQGLRCLPPGGAPWPAGRHQAHPDRVSAGAGRRLIAGSRGFYPSWMRNRRNIAYLRR